MAPEKAWGNIWARLRKYRLYSPGPAGSPSLMWRAAPWLVLALIPVLVHAPALSGWFCIDPLTIVSGVTRGTWTTNGLLPGWPWIDGNAGVTTEALGALAAHDWLGGHLPWWNPYSGIGLPLAGEGQNPAFFLPFVLLLALPHGLVTLRIVLMALAGLFSYALLRQLRMVPLAALVGAALFELNGTFAWLAHGPIMPVAFLPLVLLGLERARTGFSLAIVFGVAWSLSAGFPETACLDLMFAAIWAGVRLVQARERAAYAWRAGSGVVLGVLIAAPAYWPFLQALPGEFIGLHDIAGTARLLPANFALLLMPGIFGAPMAGPIVLGLPASVWIRTGGYCDLVLVVLAALALRRRMQDGAMRGAIAAWIAVTAARAWGFVPAVWLFGLVPLLRQTNVHNYILPSWSMGLAILVAWTVQDWIGGARTRWLRVVPLAAGLMGAAALLAWHDAAALWARLPLYPLSLFVCVAAPVVVLAITLPLLQARATIWRARTLAICVVADAIRLFVAPQFAGTHGRVVDTGAVEFLRRNVGMGRVLSIGALVPNYGALFGVAEIGHNYLPVPRVWVDYVRAHLMAGSDGVNFYEGGPRDARDWAALLPAYAAVGVDLVVVPAGARFFDADMPDAPVVVYRGQAMDVWRLGGAALYFGAPGCGVSAASRDDVEVDCAAPSRLERLALSWPGWRARVNDSDVAVDTDRGVFQSVALHAGMSHVVFSYTPPSEGFAWLAFAAGVIGTAGVWRGRQAATVQPV